MKKHRKPVGTNGPVAIRAGRNPEFMPVGFPTDKASMERLIVDLAIDGAAAESLVLFEGASLEKQNEENDFDFRLKGRGGDEHLDLAEIAPFNGVKGGYEGASRKYVIGELAEEVWSLIKRKSNHYASRKSRRIHLIPYVTDFRFLLSESALEYVSRLCDRRLHGFRSTAHVAPMEISAAYVRVIFPYLPSQQHGGTSEEVLRRRIVTNMDPRKVESSEGGIVMRLE